VAFDNPVTEDQTELMLQRMGITAAPGSGGDPGAVRAAAQSARLWPTDVDFDLEFLVERMVRLLLIEISAFHTFAWAEELLSDADLVAGDGEAARLVSYIRADETPHVEYLKTVLSEMRDRTVVGASGHAYRGDDLIRLTWDRAVADSLGSRRRANLDVTLGEVAYAMDGHPRKRDVLERFHELGSLRPGPSGSWVDRAGAPAA
jgi:hypothetical protein